MTVKNTARTPQTPQPSKWRDNRLAPEPITVLDYQRLTHPDDLEEALDLSYGVARLSYLVTLGVGREADDHVTSVDDLALLRDLACAAELAVLTAWRMAPPTR